VKGHLQTQNWSFDTLTAMVLAKSLRFEYTGPQSLLNKVLEGACYDSYKSAAIALSGAPESFRLTLLPTLQAQTDPLKQTRLGLLLMYMGFEQGTQAFLTALQHQNIAVRSLALREVIGLPADLLERKGEANGLPLSARVVSALVPTLRQLQAQCVQHHQTRAGEPDVGSSMPLASAASPVLFGAPDKQVTWQVVKFCLQHAFLECQPFLAALRCHPDHHVARLVIGAYAKRGCDEGTLAIMAEHLLEPGAGQQDIKNYEVFALLLSLSESLLAYAHREAAPAVRAKAVELVMRVLDEALVSPSAANRLIQVRGMYSSLGENLLKVLMLAKPFGAEPLLARMLALESLIPVIRAFALIHYVELTGVVPPERPYVVDALLKSAQGKDYSYKGSSWFARIAQELGGCTPRSVENDASEVLQLCMALGEAVSKTCVGSQGRRYLDANQIQALVGKLLVLCRSAESDRVITSHLRTALTMARELNSDRRVIGQVMRHLLDFGDIDALVLDEMTHWDAMAAHWKINAIRWSDAAELLAQANVIDPIGLENFHELEKFDRVRDMDGAFTHLLYLGGNRSTREVVKDQDHDVVKIFENFVRLLRPVITLDWVVGKRGDDWNTVINFSHEQHGYCFSCDDCGRWVDFPLIVQGLNLFLERIGHPQRIYCTGERDERAEFIGANPKLFRAARKRLRLSVLDMSLSTSKAPSTSSLKAPTLDKLKVTVPSLEQVEVKFQEPLETQVLSLEQILVSACGVAICWLLVWALIASFDIFGDILILVWLKAMAIFALSVLSVGYVLGFFSGCVSYIRAHWFARSS
jgi:hypothetical protein